MATKKTKDKKLAVKKAVIKKAVVKKAVVKKVAVKKAVIKKVVAKKVAVKKVVVKKAAIKKATVKKVVAKKGRKKKVNLDYNTIEDEIKSWKIHKDKHKDDKVIPYNMKKTYQKDLAINHKTFGWGFIINVYNNRIRVLFQDGAKTLISNYHI